MAAVGLGTWQGLTRSQPETARELMTRFVALGGEVIDSSPMYGDAEASIGSVAEELGVLEDLFLATDQ